MGGFSGSTDEATESAKDLKKELAGLASFDEMNVLQQPEAGDGGAGGSAGIGAIGGGGAGADWDLGMEDWTTEANKIADDLTKVFEGLGVELKAIFGSVGETFKGIFSNAGVSEMFANLRMTFWENLPFIVEGFNNLKATWLLMWEDMKASVELYAPQILGNITGLLNSILLQAFAPTTKLISMIWADFTGSLYNVWKENGVSIMDNLGQFVTNITALFQSIWDNVLAPIIQPFLEMLENLWNDTLKGVVEEVMRFVAKLVDTALVIYNNFISPIVNALLVILKPAFDFIGNIISSVFQLVVGTIGNAIKAIIGWFNGILDFIKGVFTGNWTLAFQGLQDSASSIFWGVVDIVKGVINTIIDYYNRAVGSVNSFIQKIPNEVFQALGKNKSDVKLPTIARLAQGGIIDSPMIAMLGEAGKEAVIPLENNMGWLQELAGMINKQGGMNLTVQLGEEKIYEKFIDYVNDGTMRSNSALLNI
jgi:phage-related protein